MASLTSPPPTRPAAAPDPRHRRPLAVVAPLGGAAAALAPLVVCWGVAVVGWFLADAGTHGAPRDALRAGTLAWLTAHGSGVVVRGALVAAVPLGLTLLCAWVVWRTGLRVGDSVSGHGPDAARLADGERDLTAPTAVGLFTAGYAVVVVLAAAVAGDPSTSPSTGRALVGALLLAGLVGGTAVATGSGRLPVLLARVPVGARRTVATARRVLLWQLAASAVLVLVVLAADLPTAANVLDQVGEGAGATVSVVVLCLLLVPNAVGLGAAYLLGPGFAVGAGTVVSPGLVVLGPLPLLPLLAALPDDGATSGAVAALVAVPGLVAALAVLRTRRRDPLLRWEEAALDGAVAGVLAGLALAVAVGLCGGAVGPGRMATVGAATGEVLLHAVPLLGLGGLVGGLVACALARRALRAPAPAPAEDPEEPAAP